MRVEVNKIIATAGGIGYLPVAPGTWASIAASTAWYFAFRNNPDAFLIQLAVVAFLIVAGIYCSGKMQTDSQKDPSIVVIDEVAGMCVTLFLIPATFQNIFAALVLFRFFDILKPFGIRSMERLKKGWGIMFDDILAGIYSHVLLSTLILVQVW